MKKNKFIHFYILAYFLISLFFLSSFPFVHSDEAWLSGLSRNIYESANFGVTESFFDTYPRYPHAIKSIFHLIQIVFMKVFFYNIFSFRLISLIFSTASLCLFYKLATTLIKSAKLRTIVTVLLSLSIQFIYHSHFARQEAVLLFAILLVANILLSEHKHKFMLAGLVCGLSIGIHPNALILASVAGFLAFYSFFLKSKIDFKKLFTLVGITAAFAGFFVLLSLSFDSDFLSNYAKFGEQFETSSSLIAKAGEFFSFFSRLFNMTSGTYYTPNIRIELVLFALSLAFSLLMIIRKKGKSTLLMPATIILAISAGSIVIGRFNQTSIVFFFPFFYLLIAALAEVLGKRIKNLPTKIVSLLLVCMIPLFSLFQVFTHIGQNNSYQSYLSEISKHIPKGAMTIANLNAEFAFDNGALLDYRNLSLLAQSGTDIASYIAENGVEYLVISSEIEFIYSQRPRWNAVYGNLNYYADLTAYLAENCTLIHEFVDNTYGVRIVRFMNSDKYGFTIRIYKVDA